MISDDLLLTFVIPAFNASSHIHVCLDSILNFKYTCFEVVIIDDGSDDDTWNILNEYSSKDSRIKIFTKHNEGQGVARNLGVKHASGEFIAFVDVDDSIDGEYFDILMPYLVSGNSFDFLNFRMDFLSEERIVKHRLPYFDSSMLIGDDIFSDSLLDRSVYSSPCNKVYRKAFLLENSIEFPKVRKNEDILYSRLVSYHAEKCIFINEILYHVSMTSGSTSRSMSAMSIIDTLHIFSELECFLIEQGDYAKFRKILSASKKKVFSNLNILCALRIDDEEEYNKSIRAFKTSSIYSDFLSFSGFFSLSIKNKAMYIFILLGGCYVSRYVLSKFIRKLTY